VGSQAAQGDEWAKAHFFFGPNHGPEASHGGSRTMALNLDQIRALAERVAHSHGLDVVDIEYQGGGGKHRTLRVYIEKNAEERAKLLAQVQRSSAERTPAPKLEDAEDEDFADDDDAGMDEDEDEGDFEDDEPDSIPEDGAEEDDEFEDEDSDDDGEYDHEAFLRSLPSVQNLEHLSGVTHTHCEQFSRDFGTVLDVEELVPGMEYLLEVSSPGLDRRLQKEADYLRFTGSLVKLQTFEPVAGNRHWQGRLTQVAGGTITVTPLEEKKGKKGKKPATEPKPVDILLNNVEKANLVPEF
jgi:ribosome maturation factor RimP